MLYTGNLEVAKTLLQMKEFSNRPPGWPNS